MRCWSLIVLAAIIGCLMPQQNLPKSANAAEVQNPITAGDVEIAIGEGREIIAPPDSATAGSKWIEHTVTYTNKSTRPIWIVGYSVTHPFSGIDTRSNKDKEWLDYGLGYCGTGAKEFEIAPNASHQFTTALPEKYIGQEFRVTLPFLTAREKSPVIQAASKAHKLERPAAK